MRHLLAVVLVVACAPPPVVPSADRQGEPPLGVIRGHVVCTGLTRGNLALLLYDAARPPFPKGNGRPMSFAMIDRSVLFGDATGTGPFVAPFVLAPVTAGPYLVAALLDADTCAAQQGSGCHGPDFVPWYWTTNEPNAGDVSGGHVDVATRALVPVGVPEGGEVLNVSVVVSESATTSVALDRPAFSVSGGPRLGADPTLLVLTSEPIRADPVYEKPGPFALRFVDENGDGVPDDANGDGKPDLWPKVFVRKLSDRDPSNLREENDLNRDGVLDTDAPATYEHAGPDPMTDRPALVLLPAGVAPTAQQLAQLADPATGRPDVTRMAPQTQLTVAVRALAVDAADSTRPVPLKAVPRGSYAIIVQQFTGQTWRVPNELERCPAGATCPGMTVNESQGFALVVE